MISKDANNDGLIESNQHNTLDADWYGKVAWLSGLYLTSMAGAAEMGHWMGGRVVPAHLVTLHTINES